MARRKTAYLSDGSDSDPASDDGSEGGFNSQEDGDSRAERALFEYNGSKRRKMGGGRTKESAWEGIFGEDDDEGGGRGGRGGGRGGRGRGGRGGASRSDFTKYVLPRGYDSRTMRGSTDESELTSRAPTFVSSHTGAGAKTADEPEVDKATIELEAGGEQPVQDLEGEEGSDEGSDDNSDSSAPPSPRVRDVEDDEDDAPPAHVGLGGIGFKRAGPRPAEQAEAASGSASARPGIGGRPGIGSRANLGAQDDKPAARPSPFHRNADASGSSTPEPERARSAFAGRQPAPTISKPTALTAHEAAHFRTIQGTFGAQLLSKMGWAAGEGLGKDRSGRAVPVEVGKVLRGQGIASGMRTEDSKREARRRGEIVSDSEDEEAPQRRGRGQGKGKGASKQDKPEVDQSWRKQRKVKVKVEHKTYEQLVAEAGEGTAAGVGLVIDARGGEMREVESLSALDLSGWTPTGENAQLPELRHNLRLIVDVAKADVDALAREGRTVNEKRRWAVREEQVARAKMEEGNKRAARLEQIQVHMSDISTLASSQAAQPTPSLSPLTASFEALLGNFKDEYVKLDLDDVVVGAIAQVASDAISVTLRRADAQMRQAFADWDPFDVSSDALLSTLKQWRRAYRLPADGEPASMDQGRGMTAWESLLWALWLPKVRSSVNNEWPASAPQVAVHLLESWASILPAFIRDNILDQLILPKVRQAMEEWDGRPSRSGKTRSLSSIVFPWLPLLGHRMEEVLEAAKRRIRHVMRKWVVRDGVPEELSRWRKDIFSSKEWDDLMLRTVVPKLGVCLRDDFGINPRKQDMVPLEDWVLPWHTLLRSSVFSSLLEVNFFPKWLDILYIWLVQPNFKADEVANWFTWWKSRFPAKVLAMPAITHGFTSGLDLMQEAMHLGADAPSKLRKPVYQPPADHDRGKVSGKPKAPSAGSRSATTTAAAAPDITFRTLAEDVATQNDLVFFPTGRSDPTTGKPLFKVSRSADGRGGVLVYVTGDAVFAQNEEGGFKAVSLEEMVRRGKL